MAGQRDHIGHAGVVKTEGTSLTARAIAGSRLRLSAPAASIVPERLTTLDGNAAAQENAEPDWHDAVREARYSYLDE